MGSQCYLPPGRGDIPALTPAEAGTQLSDPRGMQGWVDLCACVLCVWAVWSDVRRLEWLQAARASSRRRRRQPGTLRVHGVWQVLRLEARTRTPHSTCPLLRHSLIPSHWPLVQCLSQPSYAWQGLFLTSLISYGVTISVIDCQCRWVHFLTGPQPTNDLVHIGVKKCCRQGLF